MIMTQPLLCRLAQSHGDAFYLLDSSRFACNYDDLLDSFRVVYPQTFIAYSYKTNYMPALCRLVNAKGGFAEVVSEMEYQLAERMGIQSGNIYYNGPYKPEESLRKALLGGTNVNLDSLVEARCAVRLARENQDRKIAVGLRCNFDIGTGVSRFGLDVEGVEFSEVLRLIGRSDNLVLAGLHCHFPSRGLESFQARAEAMKNLMARIRPSDLRYVSFGGGYFGKMAPEFATRLGVAVPAYSDYAAVVAGAMRDMFGEEGGPRLIIEPGSAVVADAMSLAARVVSLKAVRGRNIATIAASIYNANPSAKGIRRPLKVFHKGNAPVPVRTWDIVGYTCIEDDCLYAGYEGSLAVGDFVLFQNVGSYSVVFKPPFILPGIPVIDIASSGRKVVKRAETFDDIFITYDMDRT